MIAIRLEFTYDHALIIHLSREVVSAMLELVRNMLLSHALMYSYTVSSNFDHALDLCCLYVYRD